MIEAGERDGKIKADTHIIEPTSGNTGIASCLRLCRQGYRLTLTMPESMSVERRALLRAMGANLVLTPAAEGMRGAIARANEMVASDPSSLCLSSLKILRTTIHEATTGLRFGKYSGITSTPLSRALETGGTISGVARYIKKMNPNFKAIAVEPKHSPVISGGQPGKHRIQGIGAGFVPKNLDTSVIDEVITVDDEDCI